MWYVVCATVMGAPLYSCWCSLPLISTCSHKGAHMSADVRRYLQMLPVATGVMMVNFSGLWQMIAISQPPCT